MNLIYLHGFQSNAYSIKGGQLKAFCKDLANVEVHLPDLNAPPHQVMQLLSHLVERLEDVVLVGSSFGGFYATQLVARYACPAVLINPAMRPWQLFHQHFGEALLPYVVTSTWTLTQQHLSDLEQLHCAVLDCADKILILLQQGDEILDYRDAQRYYQEQHPSAMIITETGGHHAMDNFAEKIPMLLQFLKHSL